MGKTASMVSYRLPGKEGRIDPFNDVAFQIKVESSRTLTLGICQRVAVVGVTYGTLSAATSPLHGTSVKVVHSDKLKPGDGIKETYVTEDNAVKLERLAAKIADSFAFNPALPYLRGSENYDKIYRKTCEVLEEVTGIAPKRQSPIEVGGHGRKRHLAEYTEADTVSIGDLDDSWRRMEARSPPKSETR